MAENITLTSPAGAVASTPRWIVRSVTLDRGYVSNGSTITANPAASRIKVSLIGEQGHGFSYQWTGSVADTLILALNKANLSTNTLNKRVIDRLIADGVIAGTSGGAAD